jgi:hypothetical protein
MLSSVDPFDPNTWETDRLCRIYDPDLERFAIVDEEFYARLVTMKNRPASKKQASRAKFGRLRPRLWKIKPVHPGRKGKKEYFVTSAGWRNGKGTFLHVMVMKLSGKRKRSKHHRYVNHKNIPLPPGLPIRFKREWDCRLANLEWATAKQNRRTAIGVNAVKSRRRRRRLSQTKNAIRKRESRSVGQARVHKS